MNRLKEKDLVFLLDPNSWMWGPCFHIIFFFNQKCDLAIFEGALLDDPIVSKEVTLFLLNHTIGCQKRCIIQAENWETPLGFIYSAIDRGEYNECYLAAYPRQIKRHCGDFSWYSNLENFQPVINLYLELIALVRRLHSHLGFHHVLIRQEDAPYFTRGSVQSPGILIYDWIASNIGSENKKIVEPCYVLLPFNESM